MLLDPTDENPMNYSELGPDRACFHGAWLCITKASAGYLRSTAVSSSIIEVTAFVSIFVPGVAKTRPTGSLSCVCVRSVVKLASV